MSLPNFDGIINKKDAHRAESGRTRMRCRQQSQQQKTCCSRNDQIRALRFYKSTKFFFIAGVIQLQDTRSRFMAQSSCALCARSSRGCRLLTFAPANQWLRNPRVAFNSCSNEKGSRRPHREKCPNELGTKNDEIPFKLQEKRSAARKETSRKLPSFHGALC